MSIFTWLDYSERERRQMLEVVDLFRERETRDELGLGSIRDTFADLLFPGTSTIMTRARYFLIVPWIYSDLEEKKVPSAEIANRARKAETDLIEIIANAADGDHDGNIGKIAGRALKRLPSSVYWQGLATWGIRAFPGALSQYHRSLDFYYQRKKGYGARGTGPGRERDDLEDFNWHNGLISAPSNFPKECSLALTKEEALYLAERIRLVPQTAQTLLSELVEQPPDLTDVKFVWQHPYMAIMPEKTRNLVEHARNFSERMHGALLLYNLMLAELSKREDLKSPADLLASAASCSNQLQTCKGQVTNLSRSLGGTLPSCWIDASGKSEYIFDTKLQSDGIYLSDNKLPGHEADEAALPIQSLKFAQAYEGGSFVADGMRLKAWSDDHNCRFYVRVYDRTGPTEKERYKELYDAVGRIFYLFPQKG